MTAAIADVRSAVHAHEDAIEQDGRLPEPVVDAMRRSALHRLAMPDVHTARQHLLFGHQDGSPTGTAVAGREIVYAPFRLEPPGGPGS